MPEQQPDRIYLVFNADSGRWNALLDSARKALSLASCSLCALTHGLAGEKSEWNDIKCSLGIPILYLHRDDSPRAVREATAGRLPCVVAETGSEVSVIVTPEDLDACHGSLDAFGRLLRERLGPDVS